MSPPGPNSNLPQQLRHRHAHAHAHARNARVRHHKHNHKLFLYSVSVTALSEFLLLLSLSQRALLRSLSLSLSLSSVGSRHVAVCEDCDACLAFLSSFLFWNFSLLLAPSASVPFSRRPHALPARSPLAPPLLRSLHPSTPLCLSSPGKVFGAAPRSLMCRRP